MKGKFTSTERDSRDCLGGRSRWQQAPGKSDRFESRTLDAQTGAQVQGRESLGAVLRC
ncbi:MAG TPA: hypothetical protein VNV36_03155 [Pseudomonas sp.]|uniref:hypothetical protein n=1 Tax=Pseudomonas sp. TaxID=306 RepID=UPI002CE3B3C1|nr:hypothetical protein [Pseudomonas sp.]HWH85753.1 hypothetical protein [Pseudomonas sp.]